MSKFMKAVKLLDYLKAGLSKIEIEYNARLKDLFGKNKEYYKTKSLTDIIIDITKFLDDKMEPYEGMIDDLYFYFCE